MTGTLEELTKLCPRLEAEIRPRLGGLFGGFVRAYLPQTWVFRTEQDAATLVVDKNGHATAAPTADPAPDVTVRIPLREIASVLARKGPRPPPGTVQVTAHTVKGRAAIDYLTPRFGL